MNNNKGSISRRKFLKTAGALGAGSLLLPLDSLTAAQAESNSFKVRERMAHIDYKKAEQKCPQRMDIGRLMREATTELV